ncbi:recombination protein RecT [Paenibacillus lycopersici]|uniref:Recombination protein RecT n=1 Tax=Paenibacillus lycopersici TaxID=2704462 RepID=A0A6C0G5Y3_9BACL|nr:recombination protein RecT [Paenibacillus lycopersici]QHT60645.1 recombination protein RecT [Paenibacillus lycopersici]
MAASNASRNTSELAGKLQQRAPQQGGNAPAPSPAATIGAYLEKMKGQIAEAMPKHMSIERLSRIALTTIRTNPLLLQCTIPSLMAAVMQSAQLGLEPGLLGHCYLIPFRNNKTNEYEVQFIIGYKGMIDLARRSGNIQSIASHVTYENDFVELVYGLEEDLKHIPWFLRKDQKFDAGGQITGAYMVAKFKDGGHYIEFLPIQDIEAHRKRSKAANNGPWVTDYAEMCKKTAVRAGWKWLPISVEVAEAVNKDEIVRSDIKQLTEDTPINLGPDDYNVQPETEGTPADGQQQEELDLS